MSSSTKPVRKTYSRRQSTKYASGSSTVSPEYSGRTTSSNRVSDVDERPRKRRTLLDTSRDASSQEELISLLNTPSKRNSQSWAGSPDLATIPSSPTGGRSAEIAVSRNKKGKGIELNGALNRTSSLPTATRDPSPCSTSESPTSHLTTPKKPKDLTSIFEAASPQRRTQSRGDSPLNSPRKSGITKKMLSRSQTESSIESSPTKTNELTPKSKSFVVPRKADASRDNGTPTTSPEKELSRSMSRNSITSTSAQPQRESTSNTRTYAGKSRSFLVALPAAGLLTQIGEPGMKKETWDEDDEENFRVSYAELRERFGIDNSDGVDAATGDADSTGEGLSLYNPLSSITDLRSKGESRRFRDEVGYLFEGLEPNGALTVRRGSAFDIVSKLSDQEFWRKAKAAGFIPEIWERLRAAGAGNGDKVLDPILCCFVSLASEDPRDVSLLASADDFVETVITLLAIHATNDPLASSLSNDRMKLDKAETLILKRLRDIISAKHSIVPEDCQPSIRLLLSCLLSSAPTLALPHITSLLDSTISDFTNVCSRLAAYKSGLELLSDTSHSGGSSEKLCFGHIYNCLVVLDLYLIELEAEGSSLKLSKMDLRERYRALASWLVALLVVTDIMNRSDLSDGLRAQAPRCNELTFRILINLTNGSSTWTDAVAADPYTLSSTVRLTVAAHRAVLSSNAKKLDTDASTHDQDVLTSPMDRLCLALALLTNLLQERDNLAYSLQNIVIDPACDGQRSCLLGCRCDNSISAVLALVNMYISFLKSEVDDLELDFHFLRGHLAVIVGLLLLQLHSPDVDSALSSLPSTSPAQTSFQLITDALPGPSNSRTKKLDTLITNVEEFSHLYTTLTSKIGRHGQHHASAIGDGIRDGSDDIAAKDRVALSSEFSSGSDIVAEVAVSLRALRAELRSR